ncbi:MAG: hypothetical protein ACQER7_15920 [Bacteroidota bacterium]
MNHRMKNMHLTLLSAVLLSVTIILGSCENNEEEISSEDSSVVQDDALSAELFEDVFTETDLVVEEQFSRLKGEKEDSCKKVTIEELDSDTQKITIDYNEGNCKDFHERMKKGKIVIITSGNYKKEGFTRTITFENYFVNDFRVEGTQTIINQGSNEEGYITYLITLENGKITTPEGDVITREFEKTREWIKGYETPLYKWDNEYKVTGKATGTNRNDINYTRTINDPLHVSAKCRFILSGTTEIKPADKPSILIDYGDGTCDDRARATVNDKTKEIRLKR